MNSVMYPSLLLLITFLGAFVVLFKLRREYSDAASVRISDIGKNSAGMSAEQLIAIARAQAGLAYSSGPKQVQS